jgi:hypothetical protein
MSEFVYVIAYVKGDELCGPVKIGITRSPGSRLATVQTGNPHKMAYAALLMLPNRALAERVESEAHAVVSYTRGRMSGEWFEAEPDHAVTVVCQIVDNFLNEE